jgi:hypothetical protein
MRSKTLRGLPDLCAPMKMSFFSAKTASHSAGMAGLSLALIQMNRPCGSLAVVFRQEDVEGLFLHVVGGRCLGGAEAQLEFERVGVRRRFLEGDGAAHAGFRVGGERGSGGESEKENACEAEHQGEMISWTF